MKNEFRNDIRDAINGASDQFIEDALFILEKYQDVHFIQRMISEGIVSYIHISFQ